MMTAGIDIGAGTTKAVLLEDGRQILGRCLLRTGVDLQAAGQKALDEVQKSVGVTRSDIAYVASSGYGRYQLSDRDLQITDITCHGRGAHLLFPQTRCVIDIGAQSSRAMRIDERGRVSRFRLNDRCAAGAGRFLERVAKYLEVKVEELGQLSLNSREPQPISSICAVLAETEIINHVTLGKMLEDIIMGAHLSIVDRVLALARQVGVEAEITLTGGVSQNIGMVKALEARLGMKVNVAEDSTYAGALGAAYLGHRRATKRLLPGHPEERPANP